MPPTFGNSTRLFSRRTLRKGVGWVGGIWGAVIDGLVGWWIRGVRGDFIGIGVGAGVLRGEVGEGFFTGIVSA